MASLSKAHYGYVIVACCCLMMGINVGLMFSCAGIFYEPVSASIGVLVDASGFHPIFWSGSAALAVALLMGVWGVRSTRK